MGLVRCSQLLVTVTALLLASNTGVAQLPDTRKLPADFNAQYLKAMAMESSDPVAAIRIYRMAAQTGSGLAARRLSEIYSNGVPGVLPNYAEALKWHTRARDLGVQFDGGGGWGCPARCQR